MKAEISIIVPTYNAEATIGDCLDSILHQTYKDYELLIIDDHSDDNTSEIVSEYMASCNRIKYYKNNKKGVSSARNMGIRSAKGKYVVFVDADDRVSPYYLSILLGMLKKNNNDCAIASVTTNCDQLIMNDTDIADADNISADKYSLLLCGNRTIGGFAFNKIYKKEILSEYSIMFDENISTCEDLLFNIEYFMHTESIVYKDIPLYYYKLDASSSVNNLNHDRWFDILEVYNRLKQMNFSGSVKSCIDYNYAQIILEAVFRKKYCPCARYSTEELLLLKKEHARLSAHYTPMQNLKILIFRLFPAFAMKYKRRAL